MLQVFSMDLISFRYLKKPRKCTCKPDGRPLAVISTAISPTGNRHVTFNGPGICICDINSIEHISIEVKQSDGAGSYIEKIDIDPNMFDAEQINFLLQSGVLPVIWWLSRVPGRTSYSYACTLVCGKRIGYKPIPNNSQVSG